MTKNHYQKRYDLAHTYMRNSAHDCNEFNRWAARVAYYRDKIRELNKVIV